MVVGWGFGSGFGVQSLCFVVSGFGFQVSDSRIRVEGLGCGVSAGAGGASWWACAVRQTPFLIVDLTLSI